MNFTTMYIVGNYLLARIINKRYFCSYKNYKILGDFRDIFSCYKEMKIQTADIVLLETDLLDLEEIQLVKTLKNEFPSTKIIIKTSQKSKDKILEALSCGVSGYISETNSDVRTAADVVEKDGFWLEYSIARRIFSSLSELNLKANEALKENQLLKNLLTQRELEVLKLITQGKTNSQIAKEIIVSTNTAKAHVGSILAKLSVTDRVQAAVKAVKADLF